MMPRQIAIVEEVQEILDRATQRALQNNRSVSIDSLIETELTEEEMEILDESICIFQEFFVD